MASKRDAANRKNAARSTGPRTAAGKAISSLNALTHGLTSASAVLPGEDPLQVAALEASLASQYEQTPVARALCAQYSSVFWRLARLRRLEAVALTLSDIGRFACATGDNQDVVAKGQPTLDEVRCSDDRYELSRDLDAAIEQMSSLSRYEAMLFAQLVRLTDMLEPYCLPLHADPALPPSSGPGDAG